MIDLLARSKDVKSPRTRRSGTTHNRRRARGASRSTDASRSEPTSPPAETPPPAPPSTVTEIATAVAQVGFLTAFAKTGNVTLACDASGVGRRTHYNWQETDPAYAALFNEAKVEARERLEGEAYRRAVDGLERLKFDKYGAPLIDPRLPAFINPLTEKLEGQPYIERYYSDSLLVQLLRGAWPEKYATSTIKGTGKDGSILLEAIVGGLVDDDDKDKPK